MPGFNPFRYRFPYTNINDINLDWLIKKVRKLSEDVAILNPERMDEIAQQAEAAEQTAQDALETAEGVSGIATDAETIARAAQTTANNAADTAQAAGTAAAAAQTTANNAADSAQAAGTAAAAAQTTANQNRVAIAIIANDDTAPQNILKGQYVVWYGGLYKASTAIASGTTLTSSNLSAVIGGGLNDLKTLQTITPTFDDTKLENVVVKLRGYVLTVTGTIKQNVLSAGYNSISFSLPSEYAKDTNPLLMFCPTGTADDSKSFHGVMTGSAISVRASDSNSVGTGLNFFAITTINI